MRSAAGAHSCMPTAERATSVNSLITNEKRHVHPAGGRHSIQKDESAVQHSVPEGGTPRLMHRRPFTESFQLVANCNKEITIRRSVTRPAEPNTNTELRRS